MQECGCCHESRNVRRRPRRGVRRPPGSIWRSSCPDGVPGLTNAVARRSNLPEERQRTSEAARRLVEAWPVFTENGPAAASSPEQLAVSRVFLMVVGWRSSSPGPPSLQNHAWMRKMQAACLGAGPSVFLRDSSGGDSVAPTTADFGEISNLRCGISTKVRSSCIENSPKLPFGTVVAH